MQIKRVVLILPVFATLLLLGCSGGEVTDPATDATPVTARKSAAFTGKRKTTKPPGPRINTDRSTAPAGDL